MRDSEVYLKAAKFIAKHNYYSCRTIDVIAGGCTYSAARVRYEGYFKLPGPCKTAWLANDQMPLGKPQQDWRVLALLFMHHIAKDEEKA